MTPQTVSPRGLALTRQFEGLALQSYQDPTGVWTIGYGHTGPDVHPGLCITPQQAEDLLAHDLDRASACLRRSVSAALTQNQFDALADLVFNLGCTRFTGSTLLRLLNQGDYAAAALQFARWNRAGNRPLPGLTRRRAAEAALFNTPGSTTP